MSEALRTSLKSALGSFATQPLPIASRELFRILGYVSDRTLPIGSVDAFSKQFDPAGRLDHPSALKSDWKSIHLLFQLTDQELSRQNPLFKDISVQQSLFQSYVFFAVELKGGDYARGKLTGLVRQLNRIFPMPVMVLIKHLSDKQPALSIAVINRRRHKLDSAEDVLEKAAIIRDISITSPHRGHLDILCSLALPTLVHPQKRPITDFDTLHSAWEQIFNVELLNERFYEELANWYFWAMKHCHFPLLDESADKYFLFKDRTKVREHEAKSLIRLLTRTLFVWFIKQRDLVPDSFFDPVDLEKSILKNFDPESSDSNYYKAVLQNLFFATLNQTHREREFRKEGQHQNTSTLLRYKKALKSPEAFVKIIEDTTPFLNGGLFECLDYPHPTKKGPQGGAVIIYEDGFSDREENPLHLPNFLFFGKERFADLSGEHEYNETKKSHESVRGLIHIFNTYKFTIVENTPIDQEIALDPELLGQVFENLLASYNPETQTTARKQTGSFYTPRPVVGYMVDESLKIHLTGVLTKKAGMQEAEAREGLDSLFAYSEKEHAFSEAEVRILISAIDSLKILDPACGSGAFPMGVLQKLVYILSKLDPDNKRWKETQLDKLDSAPMRESLERDFEDNDDDYGRKLYLIENCIYGVDIQSIAIQVSKLRFFISLIVDQRVDRSKENFGVRPLPNLETKFVTADTLIQVDKPTAQAELFEITTVAELKKQLKRVRHSLFSAKTPRTKRKYREEDKEIREEIAAELEKNGWATNSARELSAWDPFNQNAIAGYFEPDWMFGEAGFHIVIGNPPYQRIQGIQQTNPKAAAYYKKHYDAATGSFDLYVIFMERGMQLIKDDGILNFINPDKWVNASFGKGFREFAVQNRNVHKLVSFGAHQVFTACTYSSLLWMGRAPTDYIMYAKIAPDESKTALIEDELAKLEPKAFAQIPFSTLSEDPWILPSLESAGAMGKILSINRKTSDLFRIFVGLQTSKDSVYFLKDAIDNGDEYSAYSPELEESITIEKGLVRPLLLGDQVHRFEAIESSNLVVFPYNAECDGFPELLDEGTIKHRYPKGWSYLKRCEDILRGRESGRFDNSEWYQFGRKQGINEGGTPKLLAPDISLGGNFSIDRTGRFYTTTTLYGYIKHEHVWESYEFLLAIMNSKVLWFYLKTSGSVLANGYFRYKPAYLQNFPIPEVSRASESVITSLVHCLLHSKANDTSPGISTFLDDLIDACVMECYFCDHMAERKLLFHDSLAPHLSKFDPKAGKDSQRGFIENLHNTLNAPSHAVRNQLLRLTADSPDLLAIIKGKELA